MVDRSDKGVELVPVSAQYPLDFRTIIVERYPSAPIAYPPFLIWAMKSNGNRIPVDLPARRSEIIADVMVDRLCVGKYPRTAKCLGFLSSELAVENFNGGVKIHYRKSIAVQTIP